MAENDCFAGVGRLPIRFANPILQKRSGPDHTKTTTFLFENLLTPVSILRSRMSRSQRFRWCSRVAFCQQLASFPADMLAPSEGARCNGVTKSGKRCSITAQSTMRDSAGRLVGQPLSLGLPRCLFHAEFFQVVPAELRDEVVTYAYIDLETDSLDYLSGNIVELGALVSGSRAAFSTVINPGNRGSQDPDAVHGISPGEISQGPPFHWGK